jgi:ATP-binding cassette subfamily F protein 3
MEALSTKTLELSSGDKPESPSRVRLFYGNYSYYLEKVSSESSNGIIGDTNNVISDTVNANSAEQRMQNKQRQTAIRRIERQEAEMLKAIEELEKEKAKWEAELFNPAVYSNGEKAKAVKRKMDECATAIKAKTVEWETLAAQLEAQIAQLTSQTEPNK